MNLKAIMKRLIVVMVVLSILVCASCSATEEFDYKKKYSSQSAADKDMKSFVKQNNELFKNAAESMIGYERIQYDIYQDPSHDDKSEFKPFAVQTIWINGESEQTKEFDNEYIKELMKKGYWGAINHRGEYDYQVVTFSANFVISMGIFPGDIDFVYVRNEEDIEKYIDDISKVKGEKVYDYKCERICDNFFLTSRQ